MAEKLDEKELVSFEKLLMANVIQLDAVTQLPIEKGLITEGEFYQGLETFSMIDVREYKGVNL